MSLVEGKVDKKQVAQFSVPKDKVEQAREFIEKLLRSVSLLNTLDIKESRTTQQGAYQETILTVQFNGYSTSMLESLFRETHGSPVVLQKFQAQIDHGLMTGSIEFLLLGK